jgi:hypothetical protein
VGDSGKQTTVVRDSKLADGGKWAVVQDAIGSWRKTIRFCLICTAIGTPPDFATWLLVRR